MSVVVVPGEVISAESDFLRGHGVYLQKETSNDGRDENLLISSVTGVVERVNQLISVRQLHSRYVGEVGHLVVGRISDVGSKAWRVDLGAHRNALLHLSSVNLPGGALRIRTYEDQLQMRSFYKENDLISAEVQQINSDGMICLHTRSFKYGKLENGQLLKVPQALIKNLKQHFINLSPPISVDIILGMNGNVWLTRSIPAEWNEGIEADVEANVMASKAETLAKLRHLHATTPIREDERKRICRVRNSIVILYKAFRFITPEAITKVYEKSLLEDIAVQDMLKIEVSPLLLSRDDNSMQL